MIHHENGNDSQLSDSSALVLVVEDHEPYREVVCRALEGYVPGVRTLAADSVAAALSILTAHAVKVMVTDMTLPDGTALDLLAQARQHVANGMKVILFSNYSSVEMKPLQARTDIHAVLTKEQGLRDLAKAVREVSDAVAHGPRVPLEACGA
ncbi:MAG TPA: response regulator [Prosthecobacter sp.]